MIHTIHNDSELDTLFGDNRFVIIDFCTTWCGPCHLIKPYFQRLAANYSVPNSLAFASVNGNDVREVVDRYDIHAFPTFKFFDSGTPISLLVTDEYQQGGPQLVGKIVGAQPKALQEAVEQLYEMVNKAAGVEDDTTKSQDTDDDLSTAWHTKRESWQRRAEKERSKAECEELKRQNELLKREEKEHRKEEKKLEKQHKRDQKRLGYEAATEETQPTTS